MRGAQDRGTGHYITVDSHCWEGQKPARIGKAIFPAIKKTKAKHGGIFFFNLKINKEEK